MSPRSDAPASATHPRRAPRLIAGIAAVLLCAIILELGGNLLLHRLAERELVSSEATRQIALQLGDAERVAEAAPRPDRARLMRALSSATVQLNWVPSTVITDFSGSLAPLGAMRGRLEREAPALAGKRLRLNLLPSTQEGRRDLLGALALRDGSFVTFRVRPYLDAPPSPVLIMLLHVLLMAVVMGVALLLVASLLRPLRDLAAAADATGRGEVGHIVPSGPDEVRRVATAFAAMQARLTRMVEDHTQALIAVSHDLRTPMQRLRLRSANIADPEARDAIAQDLAEMERFIDSALSYMRDGEQEAWRLVDLGALLATVADDASDMGHDVTYHGPDSLTVTTRPVALRRMIDNLVDNGCRHAPHVTITLLPMPDALRITIADDGPGIPPERREEALLPFRRLGNATRDGAAGVSGAGLGLPAARRTAQELGGSLSLFASEPGGLAVEIVLPAPVAEKPPAPALP